MRARVCVSIVAKDVGEMESKALTALDLGADLVELRLDHLRELDLERVGDLVSRLRERLVVTLRPAWEGGGFRGGEEERAEILSRLAALSPAYMDLELNSEIVGRVSEKISGDTKTIISWHDFNSTPPLNQLQELAERALSKGDVAKIIPTARGFSDNLTALELYRRVDKGRLICFAMGGAGVPSRILSALIGAPIAYSCLPGEEAAPGQINITEFRRLLELVAGP